MQIQCNYESMLECTEKLSQILSEDGITNDSMNRFYETAMNVEWQGKNADDFRTEVRNIMDLYNGGAKLFPGVLQRLAGRPEFVGKKYKALEQTLQQEHYERMYE